MQKRQINIFIPVDLFKKFKHKVVDTDKNMTEVLIRLIEDFVKK